jgi:2,5-diketo-D-gluconate reductase A
VHSPLRPPPLTQPTLAAVADRRGAAPAQVVLAWHLAHDIRSSRNQFTPDRISENYQALELSLSAADVAEIDTPVAAADRTDHTM